MLECLTADCKENIAAGLVDIVQKLCSEKDLKSEKPIPAGCVEILRAEAGNLLAQVSSKDDTTIAVRAFVNALPMAEARIRPLLGKMCECIFPLNWGSIKAEDLKLVDLAKGSDEFNKINATVQSTMSGTNIVSIQRIQNVPLWRTYMVEKSNIETKTMGKPNEQQLFYGSGALDPNPISRDGFDMRLRGNAGLEFFLSAKDASAVASSFNGSHQIFYAKVLVGESGPLDSNKKLPAFKDEQKSKDRYDSVYNGSNMYTVYRNSQAYPSHMISY